MALLLNTANQICTDIASNHGSHKGACHVFLFCLLTIRTCTDFTDVEGTLHT